MKITQKFTKILFFYVQEVNIYLKRIKIYVILKRKVILAHPSKVFRGVNMAYIT